VEATLDRGAGFMDTAIPGQCCQRSFMSLCSVVEMTKNLWLMCKVTFWY
jgi:hypothetical protein